jgi:hypothetical protein
MLMCTNTCLHRLWRQQDAMQSACLLLICRSTVQMMEQEGAVVAKQEERKHNLQSLHRISVAGFVVRRVTSRHTVCCPDYAVLLRHTCSFSLFAACQLLHDAHT